MNRLLQSDAAYVLGAVALAALVGLVFAGEPGALRAALPRVTPLAIQLALVLLVISGWAARKVIVASFRGHGLRAVAMGILGLVLVSVLPPRTHRIYYDEDIYENMAQNILWRGRAEMCNEGVIEAGVFECAAAEYNKEPGAYPVLLSLLFRFTGVEEASAFWLNRVFFATGVVLAYWLGCLLFGDGRLGLAAAILQMLTPENLLWGATAAVEPGAAAFAALGIGAWLLFLERASASTLLFAASAIALAAQFRPESILVVVWAVLAALILRAVRPTGWKPQAAALLLTVVLLVPHLAHLRTVSGEGWGSPDGAKFSSSYVAPNLRDNALYLVEGKEYPLYFTLLVLLGLALPGDPRPKWLVVAWFVLAFGVFIPFHAGSYRYGADIRFSLLSAIPLALLGARGATRAGRWLHSRLHTRAAASLPLLAAIFFFTVYLPLVRAVGKEAWAARADHRAARLMLDHLPPDSLVLTHNPGMFQVMGQSAAQASIATYRPDALESYFRRFAGGVYFHYNFWCNVSDPVQNRFCTQILTAYPTRVVFEQDAGFYRYVLYRVLPPLGAAAPTGEDTSSGSHPP